jgi:hypothetical protein
MRTLYAFAAILAAVPLGIGGLCCCVLEARAEQAHEAPASCCTTPAPQDASQDQHDDGCGCPERIPEALAPAFPSGTALALAVDSFAAVPAAPAPFIALSHVPAPSRPVAPPGPPLDRTFSVLRC